MSNEGWGKGWPVVNQSTPVADWPQPIVESKEPWPEAWADAAKYGLGVTKDGKHVPLNEFYVGVDISTKPDITVIIGKMKDGQLIADYFTGEAAQTKIKEYENAIPTHDPYTNPDMHIYHECGCGAILDPNTKSFAELNTAASQVGWKIRWGHDHYKAYCRKCGEGVE